MPTAIPCLLMRGGTSKGPFFNAAHLPQDVATRDRVLLAAMGSPDRRQIDGIGGGHPLTSKIGIVSESTQAGVDLEFLFAQVQPDGNTVDTRPNCGNMLAAAVPFALATGMLQAEGESATFRVLARNTGMLADVTLALSAGQLADGGSACIDGVPGTAAAIEICFLETAGSVCKSLLPTGRPRDRIAVAGEGYAPFSIDITCIDNGMPLVIFNAADLGASGYESVAELDANTELRRRIEALRLQAAQAMGLGDVAAKNYPKMTMVAPPRQSGAICTRSFIPHVCHESIGVLAAVTVGTAVHLPGSVCDGLALRPKGADAATVPIEHPSGLMTVRLTGRATQVDAPPQVALLRTARVLMRGEVMVPKAIWGGQA
ncbi:4-oxalomesaconate tautomerase [Comamonas koreensis]|uniref:4-oxalomesaconate tautomerase n=1 Tax=Comamonas koreensis TaxID=160825 RepID=A0AAW4XVM5_9BURK|nr:4-oxalomesaconate tautomerase [Comamonas koreensis]MCD2166197.1 4-oxalomesaconate tautomerase [Comamonas koreensis]